MWPVDLMLDELQRQRHLADVRLRLEREKRAVEVKSKQPQKRDRRSDRDRDVAVDDVSVPYMKPVSDKRGKTIERPTRPL